MKTHSIAHRTSRHRGPRTGDSLVRFVIDRFLLLPIGAAVALVWSNSAPESYFTFAHQLRFLVNEVAMAFFLALIAQEVLEALMPGGALHTWRRWGMPLVAAAGGVLGAAGAYLGYIALSYEAALTPAWPVACAIDIAAGYYVLRAIWPRGPAAAFLLLLAAATDALGLLAVAPRSFATLLDPASLAMIALAIGLAAAMRYVDVRQFWPYLAICGSLSWVAFFRAGVHPALALVPIVPFLPREARPREVFAEVPGDDDVHRAEHQWHEVVQVILFFFGLVNAGVLLRWYDTGTWAIMAGALVGRPLGILVAVAAGWSIGLKLPRHIGWRQMIVIALATSSGFTFALFFATSVLPAGPALAQLKIGALSTVVGAVFTIAVAWLLRVGRFADGAVPRKEVAWRTV
jgi:NhaA family Na+:H+ antiporter